MDATATVLVRAEINELGQRRAEEQRPRQTKQTTRQRTKQRARQAKEQTTHRQQTAGQKDKERKQT